MPNYPTPGQSTLANGLLGPPPNGDPGDGYWGLDGVAGNILPSIGTVLGDFYQVLRHPIQTAETLTDLARSVVSLIPGYTEADARVRASPSMQAVRQGLSASSPVLGLLAPGGGAEEPDPELARGVGRYFKDKYGSIDAVKQSFRDSPAEVTADLAVIVGGPAAIAARTAKTGGAVSRVAGRVARTAELLDAPAAAVRATGAVARAVPRIPTVLGDVASQTAGMLPGTGDAPIRAAFEAGEQASRGSRKALDTFLESMRARSGGVVDEGIVDQALSALREMRRRRNSQYATDKGALSLDQIQIDMDPIVQKLDDLQEGVQMTSGELPARSMQLDRINEMRKMVNDYITKEGTTALDMDRLKMDISELWVNPTDATSSGAANAAVMDMQDAIRSSILNEVPDYAPVMDAYQAAKKLIDNIEGDLKLSRTATERSTLRRLQQTMRDGVNTNLGGAVEQVKTLDPDLVPALAGTSFRSRIPHGIMRLAAGGAGIGGAGLAGSVLGGPVVGIGTAGATALASSPRLVGQASRYAGQAAGSPFGRSVSNLWSGAQVGAPRTPLSPFGPRPPINVPGAQTAIQSYLRRGGQAAYGVRPLQGAFEGQQPGMGLRTPSPEEQATINFLRQQTQQPAGVTSTGDADTERDRIEARMQRFRSGGR
jgi:hypothetical protein